MFDTVEGEKKLTPLFAVDCAFSLMQLLGALFEEKHVYIVPTGKNPRWLTVF